MASIQEVGKGDYVKVEGGKLKKIVEVYGVGPGGKLAKPSEGGFGVITEDGSRVSMWNAMAYKKAGEVEGDGKT